eukprot:CCRYP_009227-RA/>CCRYP_009227-RA protein AED:0.45 eAED:0.45 QI:0/-1/0/1/-1/1/1/0/98
MDRINSFLPLKPDSVGPPEDVSRAKLKRKTFEGGTTAWGLSPTKYVQQAVKNVETFLKNNLEGRFSLPSGDNPFPCDYAPKRMLLRCLSPAWLPTTCS